jgi:uncharacterized protein
MRYEWDEAKRQENIRKHDVDFADAVGVLEDPFGLTRDDPTAEGELRFVTLGRGFSDRLLYVVWTERGPDVTRIISARKASVGEARQYEE